jgi:hypothetical protein
MRTLLLAALDAIVVVLVLLVVGRLVGGIELSECADGVVRYQGGCCPRHRPRHVTHQGYHTTGISRDQQANALSAFINRTNGTKAQWKIATRNNKKEKGPGVGSAQYRSFGPAWWHRLRSQRQTMRHSFSMHLCCTSRISWAPSAAARWEAALQASGSGPHWQDVKA